jgi:hypothetical protein
MDSLSKFHRNGNNFNLKIMTYKFEQFNVEIINPTVEVVNVIDNINTKVCNVDILLTTDTAQFGLTLNGFTYEETWDDADVINWVGIELQNYVVNG